MGEIPMGDGACSYAMSIGCTSDTAFWPKNSRIDTSPSTPWPSVQSGMTKFAIGMIQDLTGGKRVPAQGRSPRRHRCLYAVSLRVWRVYVTGSVIPVSGGINVATGASIFGEE